jgi:hypothetical protein
VIKYWRSLLPVVWYDHGEYCSSPEQISSILDFGSRKDHRDLIYELWRISVHGVGYPGTPARPEFNLECSLPVVRPAFDAACDRWIGSKVLLHGTPAPTLVSPVRRCWSRFRGSRYLAEVKNREIPGGPIRQREEIALHLHFAKVSALNFVIQSLGT